MRGPNFIHELFGRKDPYMSTGSSRRELHKKLMRDHELAAQAAARDAAGPAVFPTDKTGQETGAEPAPAASSLSGPSLDPAPAPPTQEP